MNIIKKSKNAFFSSLFFKSLKLAKAKPKNLLYIVLFDVLFVLAVSAISYLFQSIPQPASFSLALLLMLLHFFIFVFAYSFFKYAVLDYVLGFVKEKKFSYSGLKDFFTLNVLIFLIISVVLISINVLLASAVKAEYLRNILSIVSLVIFFFIYACLNISHSLFVQGKSWRVSFTKGTKLVFMKIKKYLPVYGFGVLVMLLLFLIGNLLVFIFSLVAPNALGFYRAYVLVYSIFTVLLLYALHIINRLYFYLIVERVK